MIDQLEALSVSRQNDGKAPQAGVSNALILPALLLALWWLAARLELASPMLLVSPLKVFLLPFVDEIGRQIWPALLQSLLRMAAGFLIGGVLGVAFGFLTGVVKTADLTLAPTFSALRHVTLFAWIPLLSGWFGNGETTRLIYISLSAFFPVAFATHQGLAGVPREYLDVMTVLKLRWRTRMKKVLFPAMIPSLFIGLQLGFLAAWLATVSSEYAIGLTNGLGNYIVAGREQFRMDIVLSGVLMLAVVGYVIHRLCGQARRAAASFLGPGTQS